MNIFSYLPSCEPQLFAKCILNTNSKITIKNALALSSTSKVNHFIVNSELFFQTLIRLVDPNHPYLSTKPKKLEVINFKGQYFQSREAFSSKIESFPVEMCTTLVHEDGIDLLYFLNGINMVPLKENAQTIDLPIPENMKISNFLLKFPEAARSERFLAINIQPHLPIYIYTSDGKSYLEKIRVSGNVCQLAFVDNLLCIVEKNPMGICTLNVFDPELPESQVPIRIALPNSRPSPMTVFKSICFGKNFLIHTPDIWRPDEKQVLPISCLKNPQASLLPWQQIKLNSRYFFPIDEGLIELTYKEKGNIYQIVKLTILEDSFTRKTIDQKLENIALSTNCLSEDRLFLAYDDSREINISSYDFITGKLSDLLLIPDKPYTHSHRVHFVANKVYYLFMNEKELDSSQEKLELVTLTFGKI